MPNCLINSHSAPRKVPSEAVALVMEIITNDDGSIQIKMKLSDGVVLSNQRFPIVFDTEAQKATIGIVDLKAN